jgi:hypothetical protein
VVVVDTGQDKVALDYKVQVAVVELVNIQLVEKVVDRVWLY